MWSHPDDGVEVWLLVVVDGLVVGGEVLGGGRVHQPGGGGGYRYHLIKVNSAIKQIKREKGLDFVHRFKSCIATVHHVLRFYNISRRECKCSY
jgi:hypothetical protein